MNVLLQQRLEASITVGDSLIQPGFGDGIAGTKFDYVLANPPVGMRYDAARIDELKYSRPEDFPYGGISYSYCRF